MEDNNILLESLNKEQQQAVLTTEGYVRVVAGAGSGKTKTLVHRYAYFVKDLGIVPSRILCLTFTNKAAKEMRDRVNNFVNMYGQADFISTFHSFCVKILRGSIDRLGYPKNFVIIDEDDQKTLLKEIYSELNIKAKDIKTDTAIAYISSKKENIDYINDYVFSEYFKSNPVPDDDNLILYNIFQKYIEKQAKFRVLDFDDLIMFSVYILKMYSDVLTMWQNQFDYIMVDETQDNDAIQWEFIDMLQKVCKNLFVVGDPDQAIYEWRGADPKLLVEFDNRYPEAKTIILNRNYRSTPNILYAANSVIKNNKNRVAKDLVTNRTEEDKVIRYHGYKDRDESDFVSKEILEHVKSGGKYSDVAVLIRAAYMSRFIEQSFIDNKIPYVIYGGTKFFERKEVKDVIAYLRLIENGDNIAFRRIINVPSRKLGLKFVEKLQQLADYENNTLFNTLYNHQYEHAYNKPEIKKFIEMVTYARNLYSSNFSLEQTVRYIINTTGLINYYSDDKDGDIRIDNINELIHHIVTYEKEHPEEDNILSSYLQEITLYTNLDTIEDNTDVVKIMTIHQSKGLEFPIVFVVSLTDGMFPIKRTLYEKGENGLEEERRLMYVAMTRAENKLYLTDSDGCDWSGDRKYSSRFIREIDNQYLEYKKQKISEEELERYYSYVSKDICHYSYGEGEILRYDEETNRFKIRFYDIEDAFYLSSKEVEKTIIEHEYDDDDY